MCVYNGTDPILSPCKQTDGNLNGFNNTISHSSINIPLDQVSVFVFN